MSDPTACLNTPPLASHLGAIRALCEKHGVSRLDVFGSLCTPGFNPAKSDIDFIVEYPPGHDLGPWMRNLFALQDELQHLLGYKVDLVLSDALRNRWFRQEAEKTRTTVYRAVIGLRNRLIHGYDDIDAHRLWNIIERDLPELQREVATLVAESPHAA